MHGGVSPGHGTRNRNHTSTDGFDFIGIDSLFATGCAVAREKGNPVAIRVKLTSLMHSSMRRRTPPDCP